MKNFVNTLYKELVSVLQEGKLNEAEKYITNKFKVGDTIKLIKFNWKVTKVNFKPGKSYRDSFTFVDGKQVSIKAPPTNKNAIGYKLKHGNDTAFYYCYKAGSGKTIMKLAVKGFNESVVNEDNDNESRMAKSDLFKMSEYSKKIHDMLKDDMNLPEWVESKITKASDYLGSVKHYIEYEMERGENFNEAKLIEGIDFCKQSRLTEGEKEALLGDPKMDKSWAKKTDRLSKSQLQKERDRLKKAGFSHGNIWSGSKENMIKFQYVSQLLKEGKLTEAKIKKGDIIKMDDGEYGVVNKVSGRVAYIKLQSSPGSFHPIEAARITYKGKYKGKDLYNESLNESMIGIQTKANFKPLQLKGALDRAKIKGYQMNRLSVTLTALKLDKKDFNGAKKIIDDLGLKVTMAKESVVEGKLNEMEMNDPILIAVRARKTMLDKAKSAPKLQKISTKQYYKLMDKEIDIINQMKDAAKEFDQMNSDMLQDAGQKGEAWSDKDANKWGGGLDRLQTKVEKLAAKKKKVKADIMNYRVN